VRQAIKTFSGPTRLQKAQPKTNKSKRHFIFPDHQFFRRLRNYAKTTARTNAVFTLTPDHDNDYLSGMRTWSQSAMRAAEGLSRLHNPITD